MTTERCFVDRIKSPNGSTTACRRRGLSYGALMRYEHLNSAEEILTLLDHFYAHVEVSRFPLPLHHASFYISAIACQPRLDRWDIHERFLQKAWEKPPVKWMTYLDLNARLPELLLMRLDKMGWA